MASLDFHPNGRTTREFMIHQDPRGHWVASETHGLVEGVFFTCKAARRFATREADGDPARVYVEPAAGPVAP